MASADKRQLGADLSAYLDGELSPRRARRIERLLEESEDARHLLAELRAVSRDLGDLPRMHAPEGLVERIRHAAKRWVASPPRRVPASRVRVLRLVTRVVASAAVIVVCVFAGWMVRDRVAPRVSAVSDGVTRGALATEERAAKTLVRGGRPGRGAPADVAAAEAPAVAMGELRSLGYTGDDVDAEAESVPLAEAPFLGEEVLVAARPPLSEADESTFAFAATTPAGDVRPDVSVVVAPGDLDQFNSTLQVISAWQEQTTAGAGGLVAQFGRRDDDGNGLPPAPPADKRRAGQLARTTQQDFIVQVPPARVTEMLQSLEHQAPQQVQVVMTFKPGDLSRVQRMVMPDSALALKDELQVAESEPPPEESAPGFARARGATAFETKVPESARTGRGGGRGRVARRAVQPKESRAAGEKAGERGRPAGAVAGRTGRGKGPRDEPLSTGYARDQDMAKKDGSLPTLAKEELGELGISMLDARCPRVADVARPISEMMKQRADAPPAAGRRGMGRGFIEEGVVADSPAAGAFVLEQASELGDHLDDVHATMLDTVRRSGLAPRAEPARADRGAVTLRVTVLPPPQTTQPVSATSSPEAP